MSWGNIHIKTSSSHIPKQETSEELQKLPYTGVLEIKFKCQSGFSFLSCLFCLSCLTCRSCLTCLWYFSSDRDSCQMFPKITYSKSLNVRIVEVVHKQVGGCLILYNLKHAFVRKLDVIWPDVRVDPSKKQTVNDWMIKKVRPRHKAARLAKKEKEWFSVLEMLSYRIVEFEIITIDIQIQLDLLVPKAIMASFTIADKYTKLTKKNSWSRCI